MTLSVFFTLNGPFMPFDRGDLFEDPLDEWLASHGGGEVVGGGTQMKENNEIAFCDSQVELESKDQIDSVIDQLIKLGAPKGSFYQLEGSNDKFFFGETEGVALYLNGTELADEIYEQYSAQDVYNDLNELLKGVGMIFSHWQGANETALYLFGNSQDVIMDVISGFVADHPLCQKSRIVRWPTEITNI